MPTLPPTVHERLARCGTQIYVDGIGAHADVELQVGSMAYNHTQGATAGGHTFTVASLTSGDQARARQDTGSGFGSWSPVVAVEDAAVPPEAAPVLPIQFGRCTRCLMVCMAN